MTSTTLVKYYPTRKAAREDVKAFKANVPNSDKVKSTFSQPVKTDYGWLVKVTVTSIEQPSNEPSTEEPCECVSCRVDAVSERVDLLEQADKIAYECNDKIINIFKSLIARIEKLEAYKDEQEKAKRKALHMADDLAESVLKTMKLFN